MSRARKVAAAGFSPEAREELGRLKVKDLLVKVGPPVQPYPG